jgi:type I restriction enzyme, R subunit
MERNTYLDPHITIMKLRLLGKTLAKFVLTSGNIREATVQIKLTA